MSLPIGLVPAFLLTSRMSLYACATQLLPPHPLMVVGFFSCPAAIINKAVMGTCALASVWTDIFHVSQANT